MITLPGGVHMAYRIWLANVFQWVNDFYDANYYDSMPTQNPTGPTTGDSHVIRGSSFESDAAQTLSGVRHFGGSAYHSRDLGFRCAVINPRRSLILSVKFITRSEQHPPMQLARCRMHPCRQLLRR